MGKKQFSNEKKGARVKKSKSRGRELERQAHLFGSKKKRKRHDLVPDLFANQQIT